MSAYYKLASLVPRHRKKITSIFPNSYKFFCSFLPVIQRAGGEYVANHIRGRYGIRNAYQQIRNQLKYAEFTDFGE